MSKAVTFWLPGLLDSQRIQEAGPAFKSKDFPALQILFKKADLFPLQSNLGKPQNRDFYSTACQLFHQSSTLPVAATLASQLFDDFTADDFWLKIDPVQMVPDRDTLVLIPGKDLEIKESEAKSLIESFNQHFEQDRVRIEYGSPTDWFLRIKQPIDLHTQSLEAVSYRSIEGNNPTGNAAQYWRQLLNEASMLFFNHEVNESRRNDGLAEINGVWLWGEGQLNHNALFKRENAMIWSNDHYLKSMAALCDARSTPFPQTRQAWSLEEGEQHLLMPDTIYYKLEHLSMEEWLETLDWLENEWMKPLLALLKEKKINSLLLELGDGYRYHIQPQHLRRFWRIKNRL
ncbi:hypothetical protein QCB45_01380 [Thiomicrorhabdus sp. ZW0627]|uniref:hypothetical protein n=1 Tax=Thiomicrorhabdus sp. ZW0627 TaxID=3039774 RepID=UPI002436D84B|nr:hypothetical protein [Thiomicrorhabdus sp. ZW0627]MDG6772966.1 hypothetical protein [Thiomicrorhabdus sp. ZW0627]